MCKKLIVLGSINIDHILNMTSFPKPGQTLAGDSYQIAFGGKGANQAVAASRSGANVQFIAAVGDDDIGAKICIQLQKDHVDTGPVQFIKHEKTGVALIFVNKNGENEIGIYAGANAVITPDYLSPYQQNIITSHAILLQLEIPIATVEYAIKLAKKNQTLVVLNPAPAQKLSDEILNNIDIITPNETEAESLTGIAINNEENAAQAAKYLHQKGVKVVIITLGNKGAWVSNNGIGKLILGYQVPVIDSIAAGDTFNGMFVTALLEGKKLEEAVKYAHAAAAISVTRSGAQTSIPWRNEIEQFIAKTEK